VATYVLDHGHVAPPMDNLWYIYGWSERVLDFIALADRGFGSIVEAIRQGNI